MTCSYAQQFGTEVRFGTFRPGAAKVSSWSSALGIYVSKTYHPSVTVRVSLLTAAASVVTEKDEGLDRSERTTALYICPSLQLTGNNYLSTGAGLLRHHGPWRPENESDREVHHSIVMVVEAGRQIGKCRLGVRYTFPMIATGVAVGDGFDIGMSFLIHQAYRDLPTRRKWRKPLLPWNAVTD